MFTLVPKEVFESGKNDLREKPVSSTETAISPSIYPSSDELLDDFARYSLDLRDPTRDGCHGRSDVENVLSGLGEANPYSPKPWSQRKQNSDDHFNSANILIRTFGKCSREV